VLATALSLAIILTFAGVLGECGGVLPDEKYAGLYGLVGGWGAIGLYGLRVETNCCATKQTCERGGQSERLCGILHVINLSFGRATRNARWTLIKATSFVAGLKMGGSRFPSYRTFELGA
jgi:hypothetical protein